MTGVGSSIGFRFLDHLCMYIGSLQAYIGLEVLSLLILRRPNSREVGRSRPHIVGILCSPCFIDRGRVKDPVPFGAEPLL
jgi:hypothetical protein